MSYARILSVLSASLVAAGVAGNANAQEERWPKWYVGLHGQVPFVDDADASISGVASASEMTYDTGWGAGASLGYMPGGTDSFVDDMRFEIEFTFRHNSLDKFGITPVSSDITQKSGMVNVFYDVPTGMSLVPYLGAGAGLSTLHLDMIPPAPYMQTDDSDSVFAWQLMTGIGYAPESIPNTVFSLGYRYFSTEDPDFDLPEDAGASVIRHRLKSEYDAHHVELGARFIF